MQKIDADGFVEFIKNLKFGEIEKVFAKSEEGDEDNYSFLKLSFCAETVILYESPYHSIGVIQDCPFAPWEDVCHGVFDDLSCESEYELFIK